MLTTSVPEKSRKIKVEGTVDCLNHMWESFGTAKSSEGPKGFTFPMDANTSKYFYIYFMGIKQSLIRYWENLKRD